MAELVKRSKHSGEPICSMFGLKGCHTFLTGCLPRSEKDDNGYGYAQPCKANITFIFNPTTITAARQQTGQEQCLKSQFAQLGRYVLLTASHECQMNPTISTKC
eukprot:scaffold121953_cov20-Prasinocladus_malaysianus.AAC.2